MKFCLIDCSNLIHRAKHAVSPASLSVSDRLNPEHRYESNERIGMILHVVFNGLRRGWAKFRVDHCVGAFDGWSWRKEILSTYKANRRDRIRTPADEAELALIHQTIDVVRTFMAEQTNCTVLHAPGIEADDFIARFVALHPKSEHVIISSDGDFKQLVRSNVELFNPMSNILYTTDGILFQESRRSKKTGAAIEVQRHGETWKMEVDEQLDPIRFDPEWELFKKCIRGDASDNIAAAFPRVTEVKMRKAFYGGPLEWNNFINSYWGPDEQRQSVRQRYEDNRILIDLAAQPQPIRDLIDEMIVDVLTENHQRGPRRFVGTHFTQFCHQHGLLTLTQSASTFGRMFNQSYAGEA